jgi:hypothetical protein
MNHYVRHYTSLGSGGTAPTLIFFPNPIPVRWGSKYRPLLRRYGIGTTESRGNILLGSRSVCVLSVEGGSGTKIPSEYFARTGFGTGFSRVRDGRDRDEKTTVPSDPIRYGCWVSRFQEHVISNSSITNLNVNSHRSLLDKNVHEILK